jgi:hypothetical protein
MCFTSATSPFALFGNRGGSPENERTGRCRKARSSVNDNEITTLGEALSWTSFCKQWPWPRCAASPLSVAQQEGRSLVKNSRRLVVLVVASTLLGGVALTACSPSGSSSAREVGDVALALTGAGGFTIDTVGYTITGPSSFTKTGSIDVTNSSTVSSTIGGLPAGAGYTITLSATSTNGAESCGGTATFDVMARETVSVTVPLRCHETPTTGSVSVAGVLNVCPTIDGINATPAEVFVGSSIAVVAAAHDTDGGPSALTYAWTTSSGALTDSSAASTRFTCTAPGTVTISLSASDGDSACAATSSVTLTCTALTAQASCQLGNGAGSIQHVIYLQFDNTHLQRDRQGLNVPSDLEQMPHLLNFIRGNGTMMANDHTILISHTAGGFLTSYTGIYPDRSGQTVTNSYVRTSATGAFTFPSSFAYWTDPVSATDPTLNMVSPDGSAVPAPWVAYTRGGCDFGAVAGANIALENTGTGASGDMFKVFGPGSPQFVEATTNAASSNAKTKALTQADFVGMALHCAQGSSRCAAGEPDSLPGEPGGYAGFKGLFGAQQVFPVMGGTPEVPINDMLGNPITDPTGNAGFPGFDGMTAEVTLRYVASMQEAGIPVTFGYISDAHDYHGVAGNQHFAMGPGQVQLGGNPAMSYEGQLAAYDQSFAAFFTELASHGIDKTNSLFIITVDEGDHFAGGTPTPAGCDGVTTPCDWTNQIGEINANIDTLVQHQFPSLYSQFLASTGPYTFTVHGDDAPPFYLAKKGAGPMGQTDPDTRNFERTIAGVKGAVPSPWTGVQENMLSFMADQTGMKSLHMITTGDPARNGTFTFFANADYFITDFPTSTCETCVPAVGQAGVTSTFAWNHGDVQKEIGQTWAGFVGPGVASQPDVTVFSDHTDLKSTINALTGLRDSYRHDGRVETEALVAAALPPAIAGERAMVESLGGSYKQINAPFGQFAQDMLITSTKALQGADTADTTYTSKESSIASLTAQRDALASQIRAALDQAEFADLPIDPIAAASWTSQATSLLTSADALATAP